MPSFFNLIKRPFCHIMSKADWKSIKTPTVNPLLLLLRCDRRSRLYSERVAKNRNNMLRGVRHWLVCNFEITGALTCWVVTLIVLRCDTRSDTLQQCDTLWFQKTKSRKWHKQCTPSRCSFPDFVICYWVILSLSNKDKHIV